MNFVALVVHGLSAISVFGDRVGVRLLIAMASIALVVVVGIVVVLFVRMATVLAIPGWATYSVGLLVIILLLMMGFMLMFSLMVLGGRDSSEFLPIRDYGFFVDRFHELGVKDV
jgi:hypothetical protein